MSYDLAVWEGERPSSDQEAGERHNALYQQYIDADVDFPPTPTIAMFVEQLLRRWPDLDEVDEDDDEYEDIPWSTSPLIGEAAGPYIYFPMVYSRAEEASAYGVQVATRLGLNCFDPQEDRLLT
ncbi:hypothetical protein HD597_006066 [Nonomuraea thailandensis]|uniref:Uncharacterized protein n=1 Tax=Nonomuraea thailandensis TaxID=1188745 RepID=A0A9X2GHP9_9ACTN|nr:hypothetical protein [Nonomuraea thailandensis]MCP2359046.1 hypothetical protein [Nonomuraea thailandensis]